MSPGLIWKAFWLPRQGLTHNFPFSTKGDLGAAGPARPGPAVLQVDAGNGNVYLFIYLFLLALRPKTTASFITRRVLRTASRQSQSHKWQMNLISAPLCSEPSFLLSIQISSESFSPRSQSYLRLRLERTPAPAEHRVELPDCTVRHPEPASALSLFFFLSLSC